MKFYRRLEGPSRTWIPFWPIPTDVYVESSPWTFQSKYGFTTIYTQTKANITDAIAKNVMDMSMKSPLSIVSAEILEFKDITKSITNDSMKYMPNKA